MEIICAVSFILIVLKIVLTFNKDRYGNEALVVNILFLIIYMIPVSLLINGWGRYSKAAENVRGAYKSSTRTVSAELISYKHETVHSGEDSYEADYAVYKYELDGQTYKTQSRHEYVGVLLPVGTVCKVMIDPSDPSNGRKLYEPSNQKQREAMQKLIGIVEVGLGMFVFLLLFFSGLL